MFDPQVREDWGEHSVWFVYCEDSFLQAPYAVWNLEKEGKSIKFKPVPGTNHFVRHFFSPSIRSKNQSETLFYK